jgi:hypothetical protein
MIRISLSLGIGILLLLFPLATTLGQRDLIEIRQWATSATASSQYGEDSYSAMQAAGAPNTFACADSVSAWASLTSTEQATLTVLFDVPVIPSRVNIHQTYNPGAITGIDLLPADGSGALEVTNSADPGGSPCPGVSSIDILGDAPLVNGVTIHLDQSKLANWNEIDAVELVGLAEPGVEISMWAEYAEATSQYSGTSWSAAQVAGAPNTSVCGDAGTAWASQDSTGRDDLRVYFPHLVIPTRLTIYETYNPGAITQVDLILPDGSLLPVSNSADPGAPCPGSMILDIETEAIAIGAVIHLDQSITGNWNEIDAVQMTGRLAFDGLVRQWASDASATSQYGDSYYSALQATGGPNTRGCMDSGSAWASATVSGKDSLTVRFDEAVIPTRVEIYQTYNPGSITGIDLLPADASGAITVTNSGDPGSLGCPGVLVIDILGDVPPTDGVTIYLDQSAINNWNEIDAVRLTGRRASSK